MTGTLHGGRLLMPSGHEKAIMVHEQKDDPHPQYWTDTRGLQKVQDLVVGDADGNLNTLAKLGNAVPVLASGAGMPGGGTVNLSTPPSGGTYTAPVDGWLVLNGVSGGNATFISLSANGVITYITENVPGFGMGVYLPVKKGAVAIIEYQQIIPVLKFIYADGVSL